MTEYTPDLQKFFLEMMLHDPNAFVRVQSIFNYENFDRSLRQSAKFIKNHSEQYSSLPTHEQIKAVTGTTLSPLPNLDESHYDWFLTEFESFTKRKEMERAILKAADLIAKNEFEPVEKLIKNAIQIGLVRDMGTNYFESPASRIQKYFSSGGQTSTGWTEIDELLYGGMNRGELNIFAGGSGSGKSLLMMNLALNWLKQGLHGVYISLELSEELCGLRTDAMLASVGTRQIKADISNTEVAIKEFEKKYGSYQIKRLPAQSTVNDIKAYLREFQIQTGRKPDFVMVDYIDIVMPSTVKVDPSDLFVKDKYVCEELRNMAIELNILLVSASQLGRCLKLSTKVIANGCETEIRNVKVGDSLKSNEGDVIIKEILPITKQPVYRIKTKSGKEITCSANHMFPTTNGLKSINSGLVIGDKLQIL